MDVYNSNIYTGVYQSISGDIYLLTSLHLAVSCCFVQLYYWICISCIFLHIFAHSPSVRSPLVFWMCFQKYHDYLISFFVIEFSYVLFHLVMHIITEPGLPANEQHWYDELGEYVLISIQFGSIFQLPSNYINLSI